MRQAEDKTNKMENEKPKENLEEKVWNCAYFDSNGNGSVQRQVVNFLNREKLEPSNVLIAYTGGGSWYLQAHVYYKK